MRDDRPLQRAELFDLAQHLRGVGLEALRLRRDPRFDGRHYSPPSGDSAAGVSARWKPSKAGADLYSPISISALPSAAPPSMASVTPVMNAAAGLSRKQIAALTSASVPSRRSGTWFLSWGTIAFAAPS